jgi:pimeloyl-ACP methyl ester carboxylesterase
VHRMPTEVARETKGKERRSARQDRAPAEALESKAGADKRAANARAPWVPEHAVFLVPGLLGFERFSTFSYFADRVVAALRAGLEQSLQQPVPVVAVPIPPTASLRERQSKLVKTLADRLHALEHGEQPLHVHLVGHSTGGVDADLLTYDHPVGGGVWADVDPRAPALRARIRSVVSIGSPHQGACIARDPVTRVISQHDPRGIPELTRLIGTFVLSAMSDVDLEDFAISAYREGGKTYRFFRDVVSTWDLLADLQPSRSSLGAKLQQEVVRRSFVTIAGQPTPGESSCPPADFFFREMVKRASGWATGCAEEGELVSASVRRLNQALAAESSHELVIKAAGVELPAELDAGHNDGIVNAARQLMNPDDESELAGIVVGDHFDVVGYYDRHVWTVDDEGHEQSQQVISGLLHSGSGFRDRQFFELYRRVAGVIAAAAR